MTYPERLRLRAATIREAIDGWESDKFTVRQYAKADAYDEIATELEGQN